MAIDPTQITTVNAEELPVAPVTVNSIIVHSIDGILYQGTVSEITALVPSVNYQPYETKMLNVSNLYITQNFEESGLGKTDGLWPGWAIIDGNNGTGFNSDGVVFIGWGNVYSDMRAEVGENSKSTQVPISGFTVGESTNLGTAGKLIVSSGFDESSEYLESLRKSTTPAPSITINIMQKSRVQLFIMKLP